MTFYSHIDRYKCNDPRDYVKLKSASPGSATKTFEVSCQWSKTWTHHPDDLECVCKKQDFQFTYLFQTPLY